MASSRTESLINLDGFPKAAQHFISSTDDPETDDSITLMVYQCNNCGLIQLKNNPVSYYKNVITAASLSESSKDNLVNEWRPFANLIQKANISHSRISRILTNLVSQGLLEQVDSKRASKYKISMSGKDFLIEYRRFSEFTDDFGLTI